MRDEEIFRLTDKNLVNHLCEHPDCGRYGAHGRADSQGKMHWFCFEHEQYPHPDQKDEVTF